MACLRVDFCCLLLGLTVRCPFSAHLLTFLVAFCVIVFMLQTFVTQWLGFPKEELREPDFQ